MHKSGAATPVELSSTEYIINDNCIFVVIVRDISVRKQQEPRDKAHLNELAHITRVGLMGEMASGIAHEVNQPLTAISNYPQVGINLINSENCDFVDLVEILIRTQQQALRAGLILHRMREFIKSDPKQCPIVDINAMILESLNLFTEDIKKYGIKLTLDLLDNPPAVMANYIQIEQVVINLIRNSIDVLQSLPADQLRHLSTHTQLTDDKGILVRLKDNWPGMDNNQQKIYLCLFIQPSPPGWAWGYPSGGQRKAATVEK